MSRFLTPETLTSFAGTALAVTTLTQVIKYFIKVNPKWIALGLSLLLVNVFQPLSAPVTLSDIVIQIANCLIVTGASIGLFEGAVKPAACAICKK